MATLIVVGKHKTREVGLTQAVTVIGRDAGVTLDLGDLQVSRRHALLVRAAAGYFVKDLGSRNGVRVDNDFVRDGSLWLRPGSLLQVGRALVRTEIVSSDLEDLSDQVTLFSDQGPEEGGLIEEPEQLEDMLLQLELQGRSGTLTLSFPKGEAYVTLCLGRIMAVRCGTLNGLEALDWLLQALKARYQFSRELEPSESPLNLWFSSYRAQRRAS